MNAGRQEEDSDKKTYDELKSLIDRVESLKNIWDYEPSQILSAKATCWVVFLFFLIFFWWEGREGREGRNYVIYDVLLSFLSLSFPIFSYLFFACFVSISFSTVCFRGEIEINN